MTVNDDIRRLSSNIEALTKAIVGSAKIAGELASVQEKSLSVGQKLSDTYKDSLGDLSEIPGGVGVALTPKVDMLVAGFKQSNRSLLLLATRNKHLGGQNAAMLELMKKQVSYTGLTNEQLGSLSETLLNTSIQYGIRTDDLVKSLNNLKPTTTAAGLAGFGPQLTEALARVTGMVGPTVSDALSRALQTVLDPSLDGLSRAAQLGVVHQIRALDRAKSSDEALIIIKSILEKAGRRLDTINDNTAASMGLYGPKITADIFNMNIEQVAAIRASNEALEGISNTLQVSEEQQANFMNSWSALKAAYFSPMLRTGEKIFSVINLVPKPILQIAGFYPIFKGLRLFANSQLVIIARSIRRQSAKTSKQDALLLAGFTGWGKFLRFIPYLGTLLTAVSFGMDIFNTIAQENADSNEEQAKLLKQQRDLAKKQPESLANAMAKILDSAIRVGIERRQAGNVTGDDPNTALVASHDRLSDSIENLTNILNNNPALSGSPSDKFRTK
jgi:hypothetical protein